MIRAAEYSDIDGIVKCLEDARLFLKQSGSTQWNGPLGYPNRNTYLEDIKNGVCFVVEENNTICGAATFLGIEVEYNQTDVWLNKNSSYTTVHRICVNNESRGKGYAKALLLFCEEYSRKLGRKSIRIDTHPHNLIMQTMLKSLGYQALGQIVYSYIPLEPERLIYEKLI